MMYNIEFTPDAQADLAKLLKSEPKVYKKALSMQSVFKKEITMIRE